MAVSRTTSSLELRIKRLFEESELVSGDSEAIRKFSDKCIVPEKLVAEYVEHLAQIKIRKEKKWDWKGANGTAELAVKWHWLGWTGLDFDKLSSLRVDELSLYFSHHKITFKGKKAEKVAMIKAHIGSLLYNSMERQQPRQPPQRNVSQQVTSSLSEVETDSQSDVVDRVVGSSPSSLCKEILTGDWFYTRTPRGNIKIWAKADTYGSRLRQLY